MKRGGLGQTALFKKEEGGAGGPGKGEEKKEVSAFEAKAKIR